MKTTTNIASALIISILLWFTSCTIFNPNEHESHHCYVYAAAWLSDPDTASETAKALMPYFPDKSGRVTDVLGFMYGKWNYNFAVHKSLDLIEDWLYNEMRCWITVSNGVYNHILLVTAILKLDEYSYRVWGIDPGGGWYNEIEFEVIENNGEWITSGKYNGYNVLESCGFSFILLGPGF